MNISLTIDDLIDRVSFGSANAANIELDALDWRKPRTVGALPEVYFHRPHWDKDFSSFASDIRPKIIETESWEFKVSATPGQRAQLAFEGFDDIDRLRRRTAGRLRGKIPRRGNGGQLVHKGRYINSANRAAVFGPYFHGGVQGGDAFTTVAENVRVDGRLDGSQ